MKKALSVLFAIVLLGVFALPAQAQEPTTTITLLNPPGDILTLEVGQSVTFDIQVSSDVEFLHARTDLNEYYPGRSVFSGGPSVIRRDTEGTLHLTLTGKTPTTHQNIPDGIAPVEIVVGVRYKGGVVVVERFFFGIVVN